MNATDVLDQTRDHPGSRSDARTCSDRTEPSDQPHRSAGRDLPCRSNDPELWFAESPSDVERAKLLCAPCPLVRVCLDGALDRGEPWGVWGGQLVLAGVVVARKRPRGRPRKHSVA